MFICNTDSERIILTAPDRTQAEIYLSGGLLNRYETVLRDGSRFNAVKAYQSPQHSRETLTGGFHSAKLSPFACRIRNGGYEFRGSKYRCGKFFIAGHAVHGLMFDAKFSLIGSGADGQAAWVKIAADYSGEDGGFPFPYRLTVSYHLDSDGLTVATVAKNTGPTAMPLADGWHPYFTLGGRADDWTLQTNSATRLVFDQDLVPNGETVADTHFQTASSLRGIELDNSFVLNGHQTAACVLTGDKLRLSIFAGESYPYLQIYIPPERDSIALENLSGAPDCFNNGMGLAVLQPQQEKRFETRYVLEAR
ncbi:aldose 1-epimerase [Neisseria chenwenguii]|uniref:Aldose epimerase n=1 Tax=Neisseria chenwenguii TaxID=1853278 RepID=A0A220S4Q1_9NEIS|nr:aldose 1-epimerase [Neisseria chenwenguii]ASK28323.1 aldose epimerase [Neisseria chenwenguii]ROV55452.1 aldose 1-epimerase [Neisseria chenwenguii]